MMRLSKLLIATPSARVISASVIMVLSLSTWSNVSPVGAQGTYPAGIFDAQEPSGMAPPTAHALAGYHLTYVNDFKHPHIPRGWFPFSGLAGGIPTDRFSVSHIQLTRGLLQLKTYRDPANSNRWTTAGLCQCGRPFTYGAVFVRSRETGDHVNSVELLWPYDNQWPPEIDFNESMYKSTLTTSTVHSMGNKTDFHVLKIDMLKWHTWGVIWTPTHILFTVDGRPWHELSVPTAIPHLPMRVDFEQRVNCPSKADCPTQPTALQIDWVAEYLPN